jgi:murein DD-endopeptidase MepM/ murein hydrolase activator NlpD
MSLHGVDVVLPDDAPSITSDYRTALDVNFDIRPFRHTGIDIAGIEGRTAAIAALDGTVDNAATYYSGGNCVTIYHGTDRHGRDLVSGYFHLSQLLVDDGAIVPRGGIVGTVGMTGTTSGSVPHLHFNLFYGRGLRGLPFGHYFYDAHVNPHLYWYDGPGKVTLFDPARSYDIPNKLTYPVVGRSLAARAEANAAALAASRAVRPAR